MNLRDIPAEVLPLVEPIGDPDRDDNLPTPAQRAARVRELQLGEATVAKREAAWQILMGPHKSAAGSLGVYGPTHPCDRCAHASQSHAAPPRSDCLMADGPRVAGAKAKQCWCDGYFPKPR